MENTVFSSNCLIIYKFVWKALQHQLVLSFFYINVKLLAIILRTDYRINKKTIVTMIWKSQQGSTFYPSSFISKKWLKYLSWSVVNFDRTMQTRHGDILIARRYSGQIAITVFTSTRICEQWANCKFTCKIWTTTAIVKYKGPFTSPTTETKWTKL